MERTELLMPQDIRLGWLTLMKILKISFGPINKKIQTRSRLHRCWWRILETVSVSDRFKMLVTWCRWHNIRILPLLTPSPSLSQQDTLSPISLSPLESYGGIDNQWVIPVIIYSTKNLTVLAKLREMKSHEFWWEKSMWKVLVDVQSFTCTITVWFSRFFRFFQWE